MTITMPGVGHPDELDLDDEMFALVEQESAKKNMSVEQWIIEAIKEKMRGVSDTQAES